MVRVNTRAAGDPGGAFVGLPDQATGELVTVPNLIGEFQPIAESRLSLAGLRIGIIEYRIDESQPRRSVISQEPVAGSLVRKGTPVFLVVSEHQLFMGN
jgi:beta-lactam-binding protein with PASTA domain